MRTKIYIILIINLHTSIVTQVQKQALEATLQVPLRKVPKKGSLPVGFRHSKH